MKRMFTRSVYQQRRIWWQDVISTAAEWTLTTLLILAFWYIMLDGLFPNKPL